MDHSDCESSDSKTETEAVLDVVADMRIHIPTSDATRWSASRVVHYTDRLERAMRRVAACAQGDEAQVVRMRMVLEHLRRRAFRGLGMRRSLALTETDFKVIDAVLKQSDAHQDKA